MLDYVLLISVRHHGQIRDFAQSRREIIVQIGKINSMAAAVRVEAICGDIRYFNGAIQLQMLEILVIFFRIIHPMS